MYALEIMDDIFIFDLNNQYGIYKKYQCNLVGFLKIINFKELISYCCENYDVDPSFLEQYLNFLHCLCLKYINACF